jgi:hypothetical protein
MKIHIQNTSGTYTATATLNNLLHQAPMIRIQGKGSTEQEARRDLGGKIRALIADLTQISKLNDKAQ